MAVLWVLVMVGWLQATAQPFARKIGVADGIAGTVFTIHHDRHGFTWLGTNDGLVRYDGFEFKKYRSSEMPNHLVSNHINSIREDGDGNLLIASQEGVAWLMVATDSIRQFKRTPDVDFLDFRASAHNLMWIAGSKGLYRIQTSEFGRSEPVRIASRDSLFQKVFFDRYDGPFTFNTMGVYGMNEAGDSLVCYPPPPGNSSIRAAQFDKDNLIVSTNTNQFFWFNLSSRSYIPIRFNHPPTLENMRHAPTVFVTDKKSMWVCAIGKTYVYRSWTDVPMVFEHRGDGWGNLIHSVTEDNRGLIWLGTAEQGAVLYNPQNKYMEATPLPDTPWKFVAVSENEFWAATSNGLVHVVNGHIERFNEGLLAEAQYALCPLPDGQLLVGSMLHGLVFFSPQSKLVTKNITADKTGTAFKTPLDALVDNRGRLWIATRQGLFFGVAPYRQFARFNGVDATSINDLHMNGSTLWVAANGIYKINLADLKSLQFLSDDFNGFTSVFTADNKTVWVSSINYGFSQLTAETGEFKSLREEDGLPNNNITNIFEWNGMVWLTTNAGLVRYSTRDSTFTVFDRTAGLTGHEFSLNAYTSMPNSSNVLLGNDRSILNIALDSLTLGSTPPKAIITAFSLFYEPVVPGLEGILTKPVFMTQALVLKHTQNIISFSFSSNDMLDPRAVRYQFMLEGFSNNWITKDFQDRSATFTNLLPGEYVLRVKAISSSGITGEPSFIRISVIAPFWHSAWFIVSSIFLFTICVAIAVRYFTYQKIKRQLTELELKEQHHKEIDRISKELHDNVGSNLSLIISNLDFLQHRHSIKEVEKVSEVARNTLQQLRETIWATNQSSFTLKDFKHRLEQFVSRVPAAEPPISIAIEVEATHIDLKPGQVLNLFRIAQESIVNAIQHAKTSKIVVQIKYSDRHLVLAIQDWGTGFNANQDFDGHYGLVNINKRATALNARLQIDSAPGKGTIVSVFVPLMNT